MKKAVGHLIPFIEKGKEEQEKKLRKLGCWDDNVCWNTIISEVFFFLKKENDHAEPSIPTGSTNDFLLFDPFIVSVFVQHLRTKAVTSHLFTTLFICSSTSHLFTSRLVYWSTLKIANDLFLYLIMHYYAFVIVSLTWLAYFLSHDYLSYKFTLFFYIYFVSAWRRANARNVRLYYPYWQYTDL